MSTPATDAPDRTSDPWGPRSPHACAADRARDHELLKIAEHCQQETDRQLTRLTTRMKSAAPQALVVAS